MKTTIKRRAVFADIHQDTRGDKVHVFSVKYRKLDGTIGYKQRVSKTIKSMPGEAKFRGNISANHELLLHNHDTDRPFRIKIDLMVEYNGMIIDHTI